MGNQLFEMAGCPLPWKFIPHHHLAFRNGRGRQWLEHGPTTTLSHAWLRIPELSIWPCNRIIPVCENVTVWAKMSERHMTTLRDMSVSNEFNVGFIEHLQL